MNEKEALQHLLDTLVVDYDKYRKELETLERSDQKYVPLGNTINRYARSIAATVSLMRDPKRQIMFDHSDRSKRGVSELAKEIIEEERERRNLTPNKKTLMSFKNEHGDRISLPKKRILVVHKSISDLEHPANRRRQKRSTR